MDVEYEAETTERGVMLWNRSGAYAFPRCVGDFTAADRVTVDAFFGDVLDDGMGHGEPQTEG